MTEPQQTDPRAKPLTERLVAAYESIHGAKYLHSGAKDAMALKRLLSISNPEEILKVWVHGLEIPKEFDRVHNFAELAGKWSRLVAKPAHNPNVFTSPAPLQDTTDPTKAPFGKCSVCSLGAWMMLHVPDPAPFCAADDEAHRASRGDLNL